MEKEKELRESIRTEIFRGPSNCFIKQAELSELQKELLSSSSHYLPHCAIFLLILSQADSISRTKKPAQHNVIQHTTSVSSTPLPQHSPALLEEVGTYCSASLCMEDNPLVSSLLYTLGQSGGSDCRGQSSSAFSEQVLGDETGPL